MSEPDGVLPLSYSKEEAREFLFLMLTDLAKIASDCGEKRVASILTAVTIVLNPLGFSFEETRRFLKAGDLD